MQNKALHTIFPDSATANSDSPVRTALAGLLARADDQPGGSESGLLRAVSRPSESSNLDSSPSRTSGQAAFAQPVADVLQNLNRLQAVTDGQPGAPANSDQLIQNTFSALLSAARTQGRESASGDLPTDSHSAGSVDFVSSGVPESRATAPPELLTDVAKNLDRLRAVTEAQIAETTANTAALGTNTTAKSVGQAAASLGQSAGGFLSGLTSFPLISGLVKLFGGSGSPAAQPALPKYESPASLAFDRAVADGSAGAEISATAYDRFGNPRIDSLQSATAGFYESQTAGQKTNLTFSDTSLPDYSALLANIKAYAGDVAGASTPNPSTQNPASPLSTSVGTANTTQITVNVQAMDSRSFLDRSQDIAQAVREAMLNMHSINDVVNDL